VFMIPISNFWRKKNNIFACISTFAYFKAKIMQNGS
jgi:hypothetical protein